jgi:hypothetical protein
MVIRNIMGNIGQVKIISGNLKKINKSRNRDTIFGTANFNALIFPFNIPTNERRNN